MDFLVLPLCHSELDSESDEIADHDFRQYGSQAVEEAAPESWILLAIGDIVPVSYVPHSEEQCRGQCDHNKRHDALGVDGIMDMSSFGLGRVVGDVHERLESVEHRPESVELPAFLKRRLDLVEKFS